MGCNAIGSAVPRDSDGNDSDIVSLIVTNQTDLAIVKIQEMGECFDINMPMNFKGDTLLHYACAKGDAKLVKFLLSDPNIIRTRKNKFDMTA